MDDTLPGVLTIGVTLFASTNIDDIVLLSALFADRHLAPRAVVIGQFLGIAGLFTISAVAAAAALAIPESWIALLGIAPFWLGLQKLWRLREGVGGGRNRQDIQARELAGERRSRSQMLAVSAVTIANGGDNLAVYIPVFASGLSALPWYALIFAVMTALWCALGYALVNNPLAGSQIRRYGHLVLPFVLVALGVWILRGAMPPGR